MYKTLEHHEHAEHLAHAGHDHEHGGGEGHGEAKSRHPQIAALMVATMAAALAISEQGAKHAEIRTQLNMMSATDAWAQYQAKSTRGTLSADVMRIIGVLGPAPDEVIEGRKKAIESLRREQERFEKDPKDGKEAIAERARHFEEARDHALEQTHAYHNGSAMLELGIVLSTASAIIGSRLLIGMAGAIGVLGVLCSIAGYIHPEWGAF